jgi:hypothetical protein
MLLAKKENPRYGKKESVNSYENAMQQLFRPSLK